MAKDTTTRQTIGLDLGDEESTFVILGKEGTVTETGKVATSCAGLKKRFGRMEGALIALEVGTHSGWVSRQLKQMGHDVVVANPPFSLDKWGAEDAGTDQYKRYWRGIPPKSKGDYGFITHMIEIAKRQSGRVAVIVPHGVLFRGGAEGKIRQALIEENLLDATNAFALYIDDPSELAGVPDDVQAMMKAAAEADGKTGFKITLHMPSYLPVMQYADNRDLREQIYRAYVTRASEFGKPELDNTPLIGSILRLRREAAELLGFRSYAEVSLAAKMADTPAEVLKFLDELGARARPYAEKDYAELKAFARDELGLAELQAWDTTYVSEKLSVARYSFSDQEVKQYFPEPRVLAGLFKLVETLYGLHVREDQAPVWHPDVKFYTLTDHTGQRVGQFYLDLYARASKRGGAWMDDVITRRKTDNGIQTPVAYLNCNFSGPVGGKPALFTHDEVITLFHEAGHGLHHLLTQIEELGVSGINGVEWDAVELPSQFMENFCWEWDVLKHMTAHVETGAPLPRALFDRMLAAKNFQSGLQTLRQIEFASFDMHLHDDFDPSGPRSAQDLIDEIRRNVAVIIPPAWNRFPNNFSHIFAGGYAAGYYSYKWAEVLSADAYALFEDEAEGYGGVLNPEVGHRFWSEILAQGGARPALESFKAFRGREPTLDALLRHNGMA